jgi:hypothetical protein
VPLALVAALALLAAVAGILGGGALRREPAPAAKPRPTILSAGDLRLQVPERWARSAPLSLAGFSHVLWLRDEAAQIDAAVDLLPASSPTLLPAGIRPVGAPSVHRLDSHAAWRYRGETSSAPAVVYVAPTTSGIATVACVGATAGSSDRSCRELASAVAVSGAQRLALTQGAAFLSALPSAVTKLNKARAEGQRALAAATGHTAQANAAGALARSYRSAGATLEPLTNGEATARVAVDALGAISRAYADLADAARSRDPQRYTQAAGAVADQERLLEQSVAKAAAVMRDSGTAERRTRVASPTSTAPSSPAAGAREVPGQSGGRSILPLLVLVGSIVIVVGFVLEIRSVFKEEPTGA